jgi:hypothetical protein
LVEHLIALVENKDLTVAESEKFVSYESIQTTRCSDDNVRMRVLVFEDLGILLNRSSSVEDCCLDGWHILAETSILILDLVCKFTGVTHDQYRSLAGDRLNLLKGCQDEDGGFTETRFGLAENIDTEDALRDANLLDCRVKRAEVRSKCSPSV